MNAFRSMTFLCVALLGLYGCAKAPQNPQASEDRSAREKLQKLETEHKTVVAARDQYRQKLLAIETQQAQLRKELEEVRTTSARDLAIAADQLRARILERDSLQTQYDGFRKNIKELLGQAEASLNGSPAAPLATTSTSAPRN